MRFGCAFVKKDITYSYVNRARTAATINWGSSSSTAARPEGSGGHPSAQGAGKIPVREARGSKRTSQQPFGVFLALMAFLLVDREGYRFRVLHVAGLIGAVERHRVEALR